MQSDYSQLIPDTFTAKQKFFGFGMDMKLKDSKGNKFGLLDQKVMSWGKKFNFQDNNGKLIASAKEKVLSLGSHLQIFDQQQQKIGSIDHQRWKSMLSFKDKFSVKDRNGNLIGETEQMQMFKTSIVIFDHQHKTIGEMKKGFLNLTGDKWQCHIYGQIDRRLLIFLPALVSANQHSKDKITDGI